MRRPLSIPLNSDLQSTPIDTGVDCVKTLDRDGHLLAMNADGLCAMEIDDFSLFHNKPWPELWPEPLRPLVRSAVAAALAGKVGHFIAECPTAKGTLKWWDVSVSMMPSDAGGEARLVSISRDITARKKAESEMLEVNEHLTLAAREMAHRINNTLAVVQAIVNQTIKTTPDPKAFMAAVTMRIAAMSNANRALVTGVRNGANLESLIKDEIGAHVGSVDSRVTMSGPPVAIPASSITAFALVVHELATNAVKYGALSGDDGHVDMTWAIKNDSAGRPGLHFLWTERGGPPVTAPERKGFGSILLDRGVDDCRVERRFEPTGVVCTITLPL
ncbi:MAG: PAS domain-containing protein [Rhizobiales bacterium]|nr:PAS domain-containing protein [Hyphomicrobiales bacterium]OJY43478.1 MAG: hypothetical protein BGP08_01485 [Rhizobiales bacterium 64-17]